MAIAALISWLITAAGGFLMLGIWISRGGHKPPRTSKFPPGLIFGHFALAVIGLVLWIVYLVADNDALSWVAFVVLLPVALLGFTMLARWIPTYRTPKIVAAADTAGSGPGVPAEKHFPVVAVAGHGLFAAVTLVLVFLTALD